ncbi:MAG: hypothetical protein R3D45_09200 [Rhizobiaceae bacterium]
MGELILAAPVAGLTAKNRIQSEDVIMLRREVFGDGVVTRQEAEALFALDASCQDKCPEWPVFFCEAITDFIVHQEKPAGYISEENAAWLVRVISRDGMVDTVTELELLIKVLETARSAPESLSAYALEQVAHAVIDGKGPLVDGRQLQQGIIGRAETDLIRRILYAAAGEGQVGIARAEAEILFRLNDSSVESANDPAWTELFVKALANSLMCASGYAPPPRDVALRQEAFFDNTQADVAGFFGRMFADGLRGVLNAYQQGGSLEQAWKERNDRQAEAGASADAIDAAEAKWLASRIGRDGKLHENEKALLDFIKRESPSIHPDLLPLLDRVA